MTKIQESSTKLLNLYVADLLCLAQIEQGTFNKIISKFDVREAINEVIKIQQDKIKSKNLKILTQFSGFENENY